MAIKLLISLFSQRIKCAFYCMLLLLLLLPVLAFIKYRARLEQVKAGRQLLSFGYLLPGLVLLTQVAPRRGLSLKYAGPLFMLNVCNIFPLTLQLCSLQDVLDEYYVYAQLQPILPLLIMADTE